MIVRHLLKKDLYFDSVTLMLIATEVKKRPGVENAVVGMGTDYNLDSLRRLDMFTSEFAGLTPSDLVIAVQATDEKTADEAVQAAEKLLTQRKRSTGAGAAHVPTTQEGGARLLPDANVVLISVPGAFAARETEQALENGRHVMLFSDNVTVEDELRLKTLAEQKNLLVMGPDCGTAIINQVPLAFANVVRKGDIGLVAASGTGLQEVSSIIGRLGFGITQAIGVGGRDLSEKIGGKMTLLAANALAEDPATKVIVLISKPPAAKVLDTLFPQLKKIRKPIVIYFIGADPKLVEKAGFRPAANLEDAAFQACTLSGGQRPEPLMTATEIAAKADQAPLPGRYLRALYSGGTLCDEAQRLLLPTLGTIHSNTPVSGCQKLADALSSLGHTIIDLGDDEFTRGRAHPMIDPGLRQERLIAESADPEVGLIAFDVVLGYGSHPDMATEMVAAITKARAKSGRRPVYAACICGTKEDPQDWNHQVRVLENAGVAVFPSNVALVTFAQRCLGRKEGA